MIKNGVKESGLSVDSYLIRLMGGDAEELRPLYKTASPKELVEVLDKWDKNARLFTDFLIESEV